MIQLLSYYSIHEILVFIVIFALGIKGFITFWDWSVERLRKIFHKETQQDLEREKIHDLSEKQGKIISDVEKLSEKIDMLIGSEKADIKAYITERHHHFVYEKKWIDDYSLDSLQKRFDHYKKMGGNSFVEDLMNEIKQLPKIPPNN